MPHFCHEEIFAIMAVIPGVTYLVARLRTWFHARRQCRCPHKWEERNDQTLER